MNNNLLQLKVKERLNKIDSNDYDNIEPWKIIEAFNKSQLEWVRRQVFGNNQHKEGDESSKMLIDDLQPLINNKKLSSTKYSKYYETELIPTDYLYFKRISADGKTNCCNSRKLAIYLALQADVDNLLLDKLKSPSFEWGETFSVFGANRLKIYTNDEFDLENIILTYYRKPKNIEIVGVTNPSTGVAYAVNVDCEFKDDIAELIVDDCVAILAGDISDMNQYLRNKQNQISNN